MVRQRSVFDIVGPVMIGPSSSHTAGACRLGSLALAVFGSTPKRAHILLHGSFASTGPGHGTDLALVAGLLGMHPDDARIPSAFEMADTVGLSVSFAEADLGDVHPNTAVLELEDAAGRLVVIRGSSLGGGDVVVTQIDAFEVEVTGDLPLLVVGHVDRPGVIAAVTGLLAQSGVNVASMRMSRARRGASALMLIETDAEVGADTAASIAEQPDVTGVRRVPAV
jgi:L-serine dehydratase